MNIIEKILYALSARMPEPAGWGWFHIMWLCFIVIAIYLLYRKKDNFNEKQLKTVIGTYGFIALTFETLKQITWSFDWDFVNQVAVWDYQWYSFPFQLCSTPIYVTVICFFLKKSNIRTALLSYLAFTTILGSIATILMPDSCFTTVILTNIHTSWLHFGSFVISIYLMMTEEVKLTTENLKKALKTFIIFVGIAMAMNLIVYNSGVLNGEEFNMFYVSPYFESELPVFNTIQKSVPYPIFLFTYIFALSLGSGIIFTIAKILKKEKFKIKNIA